jgi:hypothetical protein
MASVPCTIRDGGGGGDPSSSLLLPLLGVAPSCNKRQLAVAALAALAASSAPTPDRNRCCAGLMSTTSGRRLLAEDATEYGEKALTTPPYWDTNIAAGNSSVAKKYMAGTGLLIMVLVMAGFTFRSDQYIFSNTHVNGVINELLRELVL